MKIMMLSTELIDTPTKFKNLQNERDQLLEAATIIREIVDEPDDENQITGIIKILRNQINHGLVRLQKLESIPTLSVDDELRNEWLNRVHLKMSAFNLTNKLILTPGLPKNSYSQLKSLLEDGINQLFINLSSQAHCLNHTVISSLLLYSMVMPKSIGLLFSKKLTQIRPKIIDTTKISIHDATFVIKFIKATYRMKPLAEKQLTTRDIALWDKLYKVDNTLTTHDPIDIKKAFRLLFKLYG
jgi:hypothetical protein